MPSISPEIKKLLVAAYESGRSGTYEQTAALFGVSISAVSRTLRRQRESGNIDNKPKGGNYPRKIDLDWLRNNAQQFPDARLQDRIDAWVETGGSPVGITAMSRAMAQIGWTYKKNSWRPRASTP